MEYRSKEIKAGLFIFIGFLTLCVFVFMLGDIKHLFENRKEMVIVFDYTSGLEIGANVRYAGLEVGRVKSIQLSTMAEDRGQDRIAVVTEIDPAIAIREDSIATIKTEGLMGAFYIDIQPGTGKPLPPGQPLRGQRSFEFEKVADIAKELVQQIHDFNVAAQALIQDTRLTLGDVRKSLNHVNQVIVDNRDSTREIFKNLETSSRKLELLLAESGDDLKATLKNTRSLTERADAFLQKNEGDLVDIIQQTNRLTERLNLFMDRNGKAVQELIDHLDENTRELTKNVNYAAVNFGSTMEQSNAVLLENRRNLLEMLKNLKTVSENLKAFTEDIKRNPWKLVRKSDELPVIEPARAADGRKHPLRMNRLDKVPD